MPDSSDANFEAARSVLVVFDDLVRFQTMLWNGLDALIRDQVGVGLGAVEVLQIVAATPDCRVQDVATQLVITVGGTSQAVDRLQAKGLCARRPNAMDRRSSLLEVTDSGRQLLASTDPLIRDHLRKALRDPVDAQTFQHLGDALGTLRAAAQAPPPSLPA